MSIQNGEFSGMKKEDLVNMVRSLFPKEFGKPLLLLNAIWEAIVDGKWPYRTNKGHIKGIQVKVFAFAKHAGVAPKDFHKWILVLEKIGILDVDFDEYGGFYKIFLRTKKNISIDSENSRVFNKSEATLIKPSIHIEKRDKSHNINPILGEDLDEAKRLGFESACIHTCWKQAEGREHFFMALQMAQERVPDKGNGMNRYANWASRNRKEVEEYFLTRKPMEAADQVKENLKLLKNFCYVGTTCISVDPDRHEAILELSKGRISLDLSDPKFKEALEKHCDAIKQTESANFGKIKPKPLAIDPSYLSTGKLAPPPLEGNPPTPNTGATAPLASEVSPRMDALRAHMSSVANYMSRGTKGYDKPKHFYIDPDTGQINS